MYERTASDRRRQPSAPGLPLTEMFTLTDQIDSDGRLLLEDSAPKQARKNSARLGIARRTTACPYRDTASRFGVPMNVSAYEAMRADTAEILNALAWLASQYAATDGASERGTVQALVVVSKLGTTLPLILFHRADDPVARYRELPAYIASIFKASRGIFSAGFAMLDALGAETQVSAAEVVRFADEHGHFVRKETRRACAAPTRLIERVIEVILTGRGADPAKSSLKHYIDFSTLWNFHRAEQSLVKMCSEFKQVLERVTQDSARSGGKPANPFAIRIERGKTFGEYTQQVLEKATSAQERLNLLLGRANAEEPLVLDDLLKII